MGSTYLSNLLAALRQSMTGKQPTLNKKTEEKNEEQLFGVVKKEEEKPVDLMNDSMFTGIVDFSNTKNDEPQKAEPAPLPAQPVTVKAGTTKLSKLLNNIRTQMTAPTTSVNNSVTINQPETQKVSNDVAVNEVENNPQVNNETDNAPKVQPGERGSIEWLQDLKRDVPGTQYRSFNGIEKDSTVLDTDDEGRVSKLQVPRGNGYTDLIYEISYDDSENTVALKQLASSFFNRPTTDTDTDLVLTFNENKQIIEEKFVGINDSSIVDKEKKYTYYENGRMDTFVENTYNVNSNGDVIWKNEIKYDNTEIHNQMYTKTEISMAPGAETGDDILFCDVVNNSQERNNIQILKDYSDNTITVKADDITFGQIFADDYDLNGMTLTIEGSNNIITSSKYNEELTIKGDNNVIDMAKGYDKLTIIGHNNIHKNVEEVNDLTPVDPAPSIEPTPVGPLQPGDVGTKEFFDEIFEDLHDLLENDSEFYYSMLDISYDMDYGYGGSWSDTDSFNPYSTLSGGLSNNKIDEILDVDEKGRITSANLLNNVTKGNRYGYTSPQRDINICYNEDGSATINYLAYTFLDSTYYKKRGFECSLTINENGEFTKFEYYQPVFRLGNSTYKTYASYTINNLIYNDDGSYKLLREVYYVPEDKYEDIQNALTYGLVDGRFYVCIDEREDVISKMEVFSKAYPEATFDKNGNLISELYYDANGNVRGELYYSDGNVISKSYYDADGNWITETY